jgi:hypothetical protein
VLGTSNPVAGPYFNFTVPEPTGVVGVVAPEEPALLGLVSRIVPAIVGGNAVVVLASESEPLATVELAEVLATSDVPGGVVNVLTGYKSETAPVLAGHMDVNALDDAAGALEAARDGGADACLLIVEQLGDEEGALERLQRESAALGLEVVVDVKSSEELELALERIDPELFLLSPREAEDGQAAHERVLELLTDVPAGKLAIADLASVVRAEVDELERAGVDAVVVAAGNVTELVGAAPPEV